MKGRRSFSPVKPVLSVLTIALLFALALFLGRSLTRLHYFKIGYIICADDVRADLSYLKGRSIFSVDLRKESLYLSGLYPAYKSIRLVKVFPDRIFADLTERRPIAYVRLSRYFCVDDGLVLFEMPKQAQDEQLPLIFGLERRIFSPRLGVKSDSRELGLAVNIIKEARSNRILKDYQISKIDVPGLNNASFFIARGLEVKISQEDVKSKIEILGSLINAEKDNLDNVKYIDLRFREPVIKLKDAD